MSQSNFEQDPMDLRNLVEAVDEAFEHIVREDDVAQAITLSDFGNLPAFTFEQTVETEYVPTFDDHLKSTLLLSGSVGVATYVTSQSLSAARDWSGYAELLKDTSTICAIVFSMASLSLGVKLAVETYRLRNIDRC